MRAKNVVASAWITLTALLGVGCAGCETHEYRPPALGSLQGAILRGSNGVYVVGIDNQSVSTSTGVDSRMGGNEVLLAPGKHRVSVERAVADLYTSLKYTLSSQATFEHTFAPGHSYAVGYTIGFEMVDETTGQKIQPLP